MYVFMFMSVYIDRNTHVENVEFRGQGWCLSFVRQALVFCHYVYQDGWLAGASVSASDFTMGAWGLQGMLLLLASHTHEVCEPAVLRVPGSCLSLSPELFTSCRAHF